MEVSAESIHGQLELVLAGEALSKSTTNRRLLAYLVQRSLDSGDGPKEVEIAIDVFGRDAGFNGAEDSVVRVSMRSLRQKLLEHYLGGGRDDALVFDIPKGAYRVRVTSRSTATAPAAVLAPAVEKAGDESTIAASPAVSDRRGRRWKIAAAVLACALTASLIPQVPHWLAPASAAVDRSRELVQHDPLWTAIAGSRRPLMFVLGDLFMFTQTDPTTGHTLTVRDTQINSGEDLRTLLAGNPALSSEQRGLRYASMLQPSTAVGMVEILHMLGNPGRPVEVRLSDELRAEDLRNYDIIYLGPIARLGPLANDYHVQLRYRVDAATGSVIDTQAGRNYVPEGGLGERHRDYAVVARYPGPVGNSIMVFTSGGRNAGLLQVIRTLTTPEGLRHIEGTGQAAQGLPPAFEALVAVSGYKQTDFATDLIQLHALPAPQAAIADAIP